MLLNSCTTVDRVDEWGSVEEEYCREGGSRRVGNEASGRGDERNGMEVEGRFEGFAARIAARAAGRIWNILLVDMQLLSCLFRAG